MSGFVPLTSTLKPKSLPARFETALIVLARLSCSSDDEIPVVVADSGSIFPVLVVFLLRACFY